MESPIKPPAGCRGRVGLLVSLHRVRGLREGTLAIVREPIGWACEALGAARPVFAWRVFLTGDPVHIDGHERQEIVVADACIRPISQLAQQDMEACVRRHEQGVQDEALDEVRQQVGDEAMESPEFQCALHHAFSEAQIRFASEVIGVANVLREVGFRASSEGSDECFEWFAVFEGTELKVVAGVGPFEVWRIAGFAVKERSAHCPETTMLNDWPRGRVLQAVLEIWESAFGTRFVQEVLQLGWTYRQHQRNMKSLLPPEPSLTVAGAEWRRALRWLREAAAPDPLFIGPPADSAVTLRIQDGALRVRALGHDLQVGIQRGWIDELTLSLQHLLAVPPASVRNHGIALVQLEGTLKIRGVRVPSTDQGLLAGAAAGL
ncbi:MAG: hypothetical protein J0L58_20490 [Burkholderiales bacterium]|nr:hypothetical protein [Burkholderiales bacterium]